ncbi:hypothetical protein FRC02_001719 [Tulasnella sp. 418]|nr:hypothetical protein FRC02_001719 [Tulasnella sp. 418]
MAYYTHSPTGSTSHSLNEHYRFPSPSSTSTASTLHSTRGSLSPGPYYTNEIGQLSPSPEASPKQSIQRTKSLKPYFTPNYCYSSPEIPRAGLQDLLDGEAGETPSYTIKTLMQYAIQGSTRQMLTFQEIGDAIEAKYPSFKERRWRDSARRMLSDDPAFVNVKKPLMEPGRGGYWKYDPTMAPATGRRASHSQVPTIKVEPSSSRSRSGSRSMSIVTNGYASSSSGRLVSPTIYHAPVNPAPRPQSDGGFVHYSFAPPNPYFNPSAQATQPISPTNASSPRYQPYGSPRVDVIRPKRR